MKIHVGGLPTSVDNDELKSIFVPYGTIESAIVNTPGTGTVIMPSDREGAQAISALNGSVYQGNQLTVYEVITRA